jgi:hypothetical protein
MIPLKFQKDNQSNRVGKKAETHIAKQFNTQPTPGSGSGYIKGDIQTRALVMESKATQRSSLSVYYTWLLKLMNQTPIGKIPVLVLSFIDETGKVRYNGQWACVPMSYFHTMQKTY